MASWLFVLPLLPFAPAAAPCQIVINEIDYDQPGTDTAEFVELLNVGSVDADLGELELRFVNGFGAGAAVYQAIPLPNTELAVGNYFVVCGDASAVAECDLDVSPDMNLIQNGAPDAIALVRGVTVVDSVSYEGDTGPPFTEGSGATLEDFAASDQANRGLSRFPDGTDSDRNDVDLRGACITPGRANTSATADCTPTGPAFEIFQVQGAGLDSPLAGQTVATRDNVVTAVGSGGFFIQTPETRSDGDADTPDGIFVSTDGPTVAVGDLVDVTGKVEEHKGSTQLTTAPRVEMRSPGGGTLPAPVAFDASVPSPDPSVPSCAVELECYEGMRVEIRGGTVTAPSRLGPFDPVAEASVVAGPRRAFREPGVEFPGLMMPPIPTWDGNPEVFALDPDGLGLPNQMLAAGSSFDAAGVLGSGPAGYVLLPSALTIHPAPLPVPVRAGKPGEYTIGSLNVSRLFDDVDDPPDTGLSGMPRDDQVVGTSEYERRRAKLAAYVLTVLGAPDVLAVQEAEKLDVLRELAAHIASLDSSVAYRAFLIEGNDAASLDLGFLVRETVEPDALTRLGAEEIFAPDGLLLHDRPPLLLEARHACTCPRGGARFRVLNVHLRSARGIESPAGGAFVREKRHAQAQSIARLVQELQTAEPEIPLVVIGDFNASEFTDGFVDVVGQIAGDFDPDASLLAGLDLVEPNLTNQVEKLPEDERYSFIHRGSSRALDHALTSARLAGVVRGLAYGRGNADAPEALSNDGSTPLRSSDHDGLVIYFERDCDSDGVPDQSDLCPCTEIPEAVPTRRLGVNRFALTDGDIVFDVTSPGRGGSAPTWTTSDTAGCSCTQIITALALGRGHESFGCSRGIMRGWIDRVGPDP